MTGPRALGEPGEPRARPRAYLDIETAYDQSLTVVGIMREDAGMFQLHGRNITAAAITGFLDGIGVLHTYNGHSFDLPRIKNELGLDLRKRHACRDLMRDCWRKKLMGGFKAVERQLGIARATDGVDGMMAMALWERWLEADDAEALKLLLHYNREDVENLALVRAKLDGEGYCESASNRP